MILVRSGFPSPRGDVSIQTRFMYGTLKTFRKFPSPRGDVSIQTLPLKPHVSMRLQGQVCGANRIRYRYDCPVRHKKAENP